MEHSICCRIAGWMQACNQDSRYVAIATQPVPRLQIRLIMHNQGATSTTPPSYIRVHAVVWAYGRRQTDTQTRVTTIHFASSTTHAKCNNCIYLSYEMPQLLLLALTLYLPTNHIQPSPPTDTNLTHERYQLRTVFWTVTCLSDGVFCGGLQYLGRLYLNTFCAEL